MYIKLPIVIFQIILSDKRRDPQLYYLRTFLCNTIKSALPKGYACAKLLSLGGHQICHQLLRGKVLPMALHIDVSHLRDHDYILI